MGIDLEQERILDDYKGKIIDKRYIALDYLGRGATGVVYLARDMKEDKHVAVKILRSKRFGDKKYLDRFENEAKAIGFIDHDNIAKVERVEMNVKTPYIVSEFIKGPILRNYIDSNKNLSLYKILSFMLQLLHTMWYLHSKSVIHKDIRPYNILVENGNKLKLIDFGISDFPGNEYKSPFYRDIGAVHYLSPELCRGDDYYDYRTDIYSAGIMMYEMLTGVLPFTSHRSIIISMMHIKKPPKRLREIKPDIPEELERITLKAIEKDPRDRYQNDQEMFEDIYNFMSNL